MSGSMTNHQLTPNNSFLICTLCRPLNSLPQGLKTAAVLVYVCICICVCVCVCVCKPQCLRTAAVLVQLSSLLWALSPLLLWIRFLGPSMLQVQVNNPQPPFPRIKASVPKSGFRSPPRHELFPPLLHSSTSPSPPSLLPRRGPVWLVGHHVER